MKALREREVDPADEVANQNRRAVTETRSVEAIGSPGKRPRRRMDPETARRIDGLAKAYFQEALEDVQANERLIEMVNSFKG